METDLLETSDNIAPVIVLVEGQLLLIFIHVEVQDVLQAQVQELSAERHENT